MATANPADEGRHRGKTKTKRRRNGEKHSSRETESIFCVGSFFPGNVAKLADGNANRPRNVDRSSALAASVRLALSFSTPLAALCDAFRAPRLVIRVIYAALIAPRWTITAFSAGRLSRPPLSNPFLRDSGLPFYRWGSTSALDLRVIAFSPRNIVVEEEFWRRERC